LQAAITPREYGGKEMTNQFRVVPAKRRMMDDAGFTSTSQVFCVVNQTNHVYAVFRNEIAALNYRDKLAPTMAPPALGGHVDNGYYSK
jgi:hypothetical protein